MISTRKNSTNVESVLDDKMLSMELLVLIC